MTEYTDAMELGNMIFGNSRGEYPVPRTQVLFDELVRLFDVVEPDRDNSWREYGVHFENHIFWVMPYYWGDCTCDAKDEEYCKDDCLLLKANFHHKPSGYELSWYKYPLRDSYSSLITTPELLHNIIDDCLRSLEVNDE